MSNPELSSAAEADEEYEKTVILHRKDQSHLSSAIADTRYILATHYLRFCTNILEFGTQKLPTFIDLPNRHLWCVKKGGIDDTAGAVNHVAKAPRMFDFDDFPQRQRPALNGLCLMGMEFYDDIEGVGFGENTIRHLARNMFLFDVVFIDYDITNAVAKMQAKTLHKAITKGVRGMHCSLSMYTKWRRDATLPLIGEGFANTREIRVYERVV